MGRRGKPAATVDAATVRRLVSDLIYAAGCHCCGSGDDFGTASQELAEMLDVPKMRGTNYRSWHDWRRKDNAARLKAERLAARKRRGTDGRS